MSILPESVRAEWRGCWNGPSPRRKRRRRAPRRCTENRIQYAIKARLELRWISKILNCDCKFILFYPPAQQLKIYIKAPNKCHSIANGKIMRLLWPKKSNVSWKTYINLRPSRIAAGRKTTLAFLCFHILRLIEANVGDLTTSNFLLSMLDGSLERTGSIRNVKLQWPMHEK